jgi:hypothetical protein
LKIAPRHQLRRGPPDHVTAEVKAVHYVQWRPNEPPKSVGPDLREEVCTD